MVDKEIKEWLSKYKRLPQNECQDFAIASTSNEKLITALFSLFEIIPGEVQHLDPVCRQLYDFYRSKEQRLQIFALQFVPAVIWLYLACLSQDNREVCSGVETFLLGVYNLEIVQADGTQVVETFRIPAMGRPSIFHDPRGSGLATEALTESALRILNRPHDVWRGGPHPQYESFNAQNRFCILTVVMQHYNGLVDAFHTSSLQVLCKATNDVVSCGFGNISQPRIPIHSSLLVEMVVGIYYALFNGHQSVAMQAIQATHTRARYELFSDVLLMTNGLLNSFRNGDLPKKRADQEVSLTPSGSKKILGKKHSITNASFKAKKLPDDIEFTEEEENTNKLATVEEDGEHSMAKNLKAKLMNIGGKFGGDKNKNRDGTPRRDSDVGTEVTDSVGVAVTKGSGPAGGKVMVDLVEMQPIRDKRRSKEPGIDQLDGDVIKAAAESVGHHQTPEVVKPSTKSSSSASLVFSKKLGFTKSASSSPTASTAASQHNKPAAPSETKHNTPSLPAVMVINQSSTSASATNGISNSNNSSSSSGIGSSSSSRSKTDYSPSTNSSSDKRASSEGRTLDSGETFSSILGNKDKQPKIHSSISDSNLPPTTSPSSSTSTTTRAVFNKTQSVNRNSFSTDL